MEDCGKVTEPRRGIEVSYKGLRGVELRVGNDYTMLFPDKLADFINYLSYYENWYAHFIKLSDIYHEKFLDDIDKLLDSMEKYEEFAEIGYQVGGFFASFMNSEKTGDAVVDGSARDAAAISIVGKKFIEAGGDGVTFGASFNGFCSVTAKNREKAKAFLKFFYVEYAEPVLTRIRAI
jgi:hypothetical protein